MFFLNLLIQNLKGDAGSRNTEGKFTFTPDADRQKPALFLVAESLLFFLAKVGFGEPKKALCFGLRKQNT
jgi:hypothetical protein